MKYKYKHILAQLLTIYVYMYIHLNKHPSDTCDAASSVSCEKKVFFYKNVSKKLHLL